MVTGSLTRGGAGGGLTRTVGERYPDENADAGALVVTAITAVAANAVAIFKDIVLIDIAMSSLVDRNGLRVCSPGARKVHRVWIKHSQRAT